MNRSVHLLLLGTIDNSRPSRLHSTTPGPATRLKGILEIRKSPKQVYRLGVQSEMLAALPIVQKTIEKEEEWRRRRGEILWRDYKRTPIQTRKNALNDNSSSRTILESNNEKDLYQSRSLDSSSKYYATMTSSICGLITGFCIVDYIFEDPQGVRLLYDPTIGFLSTIEKSEAKIGLYSLRLSDVVDFHVKSRPK